MARNPSGRVSTPPIQDRPADPPNSAAARRTGREEPTSRLFKVVGHKAVGGKRTGDLVDLCMTDAQAAALIEAGHVVPAKDSDRPQVAATEGD